MAVSTGTNWSKIGGAIILILGLAVLVFPIPDMYKVYVLGATQIIAAVLHYWYGTPTGSQPVPATK